VPHREDEPGQQEAQGALGEDGDAEAGECRRLAPQTLEAATTVCGEIKQQPSGLAGGEAHVHLQVGGLEPEQWGADDKRGGEGGCASAGCVGGSRLARGLFGRRQTCSGEARQAGAAEQKHNAS